MPQLPADAADRIETRFEAATVAVRRGPVNWRSVTLGLVGVTFICTLTPYNNYVLLNTDFVGNHLPASLLVFFLLFVMLVNGLLRRVAHRQALNGGELAVALSMTLVACALPSVGLMRYLPGHLVSFFFNASIDGESAALLRQMNLPDWLWPSFDNADPAARGTEAVVTQFVDRAPLNEETFVARLLAVLWTAWIAPAIAWGIFYLALVVAVICLSLVFRRQWVENEKLSFPLASVYTSLIEAPEPGRALNKLLRSTWFWYAFWLVFCLHGLNALSVYFPKNWPEIPLRYDLNGLFAEAPWNFVAFGLKSNKVLFTIIGIMFFVPGRIAFSLWSFYVLMQVVRMVCGSYQVEYTERMQTDQMVGALIAIGGAILWVGRRHLADVVRNMFGRGDRSIETRYLPDGVAAWGLLISTAVLVGWLVMAGASLVGAIVIIGLLMLVYVVLAKVVAETGLLYVLLPAPAERLWLFVGDLTGGAARTTLKSMFFSNWFFGMFQHDTRQALPVFTSHALRVADDQAYPNPSGWRKSFPFLLTLGLALGVGFVISGASSLHTHYGYAVTLDKTEEVVGRWGAFDMPREIALGATKGYVPPRQGPTEMHSRVGHFAAGATITSLLAAMNLRFAAWPLHPVGYLLANSWGLQTIWFSIFIGWLCKSVIVRFGGAHLYRLSRPVFIGLIFGEAAAVALWLCISLILSALGEPYYAIQILPS